MYYKKNKNTTAQIKFFPKKLSNIGNSIINTDGVKLSLTKQF